MNAGPVILCIFRISVHNVAVNIVAPGALRIHEPDDLRFGAGLVIIVDDIGNRAFTSVRSKETPVIYNVISKIMGVAGCAVKGRVAAGVVGDQVMMKAGVLSAPYSP